VIVADASWIIALRDPHNVHHSVATGIAEEAAGEDVLLHPVTFAECLVAPARLGRLSEAAAILRAAYEIPDVDPEAPIRWARLRAQTGLRLPDAIVLDTAITSSCDAIVTFDAKLAGAAGERGLDVQGPGRPTA
jgi:predicted nucleic acid-binding protein